MVHLENLCLWPNIAFGSFLIYDTTYWLISRGAHSNHEFGTHINIFYFGVGSIPFILALEL
jgi:hypothetical protein